MLENPHQLLPLHDKKEVSGIAVTNESRSSIAHLTQSEQSFHDSHGEWDVLPRQVGMPTEAEHHGWFG